MLTGNCVHCGNEVELETLVDTPDCGCQEVEEEDGIRTITCNLNNWSGQVVTFDAKRIGDNEYEFKLHDRDRFVVKFHAWEPESFEAECQYLEDGYWQLSGDGWTDPLATFDFHSSKPTTAIIAARCWIANHV